MRNTKVRALRRLFRAIIHQKNSNAADKKDVIGPEKAVTLWKRFKRNYTEGRIVIPKQFHDKEFHGSQKKGAKHGTIS